jgi:RNA polymerase sigma-70 factor, ECF subfamily
MRRSSYAVDDNSSVIESSAAAFGPSIDISDLYQRHVVQVYSYLIRRCGDSVVAEELTSETFLAAVDGINRVPPRTADANWLLGIARNKLVDYWRRREREERNLALVPGPTSTDDRALDTLEPDRAEMALGALPTTYRLALTLRYLDGISVPDMAEMLGQTVHATESSLARARRALRAAYEKGRIDD